MKDQPDNTPDLWKYWKAAVVAKDGELPDLQGDEPQCGYYRFRSDKYKTTVPVGIFEVEEGGTSLMCLAGFSEASGAKPTVMEIPYEKLCDRWLFIAQTPIPYKLYKQMLESGPPWPDEATYEGVEGSKVGIGHNKAPLEGFALYEHDVERHEKEILPHLDVKDDERTTDWADKLSNYKSELGKVKSAIEAEHKEEKAPHLKAGREVDNKYLPLARRCEAVAKKVRAALSKWNVQQEELAKKKMMEEAAAVQAGEKSLDEVELPKTVKNVGGAKKGGKSGQRATGFAKVRRAEITDLKKAVVDHFDHPNIVEAVQKLCDDDAQAADKGPGWKVKITEEAR